MRPVALLVSTATRWIGTARIPYWLDRAGFDVALLAPDESLAARSASVRWRATLPEACTIPAWFDAFAAAAQATAPAVAIPCDDMAFRLLALVVSAPPDALDAQHRLRLATLVRDSLGDPAFYEASVDKTVFPQAAASFGVRVPPCAVVSRREDAATFARGHGFPVVVKRPHGFAGQGVRLCNDESSLDEALAAFLAPAEDDIVRRRTPAVLVQARIRGRGRYFQVAAWRGRLLGGWCADKVVSHPEPTGPATVVRFGEDPDTREQAERLVRGLGMTGFGSLDCVVEEPGDRTFVLELNRRVTPGTHRGGLLGVDLCRALFGAMTGTVPATRERLGDRESGVHAMFPQEWRRDPASRWLDTCPVDVPWEEPELIEAMLGMGDG